MYLRKSVGARLMLAFAAVIVVLGAAVVLSISRLAAYDATVNQITGPGLAKLEITNAWIVRLLQTARHTRNMLILDDKTKIQAEVDAVAEDKLKRKGYRVALTELSSSAQEAAALQAVADLRLLYVPLEDEFLADISAGRMKEAKELLLERARPAQLAYMDALGKFGEFQKAQLLAKANALSGAYQSSRSLLISLLLGAVAIACLLAYLITRSIRGPLLQVIAHFEQMRQGKFKGQIEVTSNDEIGQVQGALKATQQTLLEASIKAADYQGQIAAIGKAQAVIEFELDGTVRTANDKFLSVLGYRLDDMKGKNHSLFVDPGYRESADYRQFWDKLRRGEHEAGVFRRIGRDGREVWLQASYNPIFDLDEKPYKVVQYATDVTEQVRMKKDLDDAVTETQAVVKAAIEGELTGRISTTGKTGQIEALSLSVNALLGSIAEVILTLKQAAVEVRTGAEEISRGNADLRQRTEEQAASLEETASSMEEMTATVKNNADNAVQANQFAAAAREQAERGGAVVGAAVSAMGAINVSSMRIGDIISVIDEIAFQTNLLALNAAVEAARAGEQGRGFAVVATEVRSLASRSAKAAKEIKGLIQDSVAKVTEGTKLVDESGKVLGEIVIGVKKVTDVMSEMANSSREQAAGIEQVNRAITTIDEKTQQNGALAEDVSRAAQALTEQATNLIQVIARYRIAETSAETALRAVPRPSARPTAERRAPTRPMTDRAAGWGRR
jgi:PAS domain S-box-containing protein